MHVDVSANCALFAPQDKAAEIIRDVISKQLCRGFGMLPIMTAVVYMACRLEGIPRTQKEICTALGADIRSANRIYTKVCRSLGINNALIRILPKHLVPRLCTKLRLNNIISDTILLCDSVADLGLLDGNSPAAAAAAVINFVCGYRNIEVDLEHICALACDKSVKKLSELKLQPYADQLIAVLKSAGGVELPTVTPPGQHTKTILL